MSSLNILCAICNEFFCNTDIIYSTRCGHVFHNHCLFEWLKVSSTCPQCRIYCLPRHCHKLFVNFLERPIEDNEEPKINIPKCYEWIWVDAAFAEIDGYLQGAFKFGQDEYGNDIYAARVEHNGDIVPAYYVPKNREAIVPWGFKSHSKAGDLELLDISEDNAEYKWVAASDGDIPENAFATGHTIMGDILYTARAEYNGKILYGKLHQRYNLAYMPYKNLEVSNRNYEVLVRIPKETSTATSPANSNNSNSSASN